MLTHIYVSHVLCTDLSEPNDLSNWK